jgi:FMN phosphatase YigB (HAD superfamily)
MTMLTALLVDYGGVLTEPMWLTHSRFCQAAGIDPDSLGRLLDDWVRDGTALPGPGLLRLMFSDIRLDEQTLSLVRDLHTAGVRTALVTNAWGRYYPFESLEGCFDAFVLSSDVGARKPDPEIYLRSAEILGVAPEQCVFVDDRADNVSGATRLGMTGVHFDQFAACHTLIWDLFRPFTSVPAVRRSNGQSNRGVHDG